MKPGGRRSTASASIFAPGRGQVGASSARPAAAAVAREPPRARRPPPAPRPRTRRVRPRPTPDDAPVPPDRQPPPRARDAQPAGARSAPAVANRSEQRMTETDTLALKRNHPVSRRELQRRQRLVAIAMRTRHQLRGRAARQRDHATPRARAPASDRPARRASCSGLPEPAGSCDSSSTPVWPNARRARARRTDSLRSPRRPDDRRPGQPESKPPSNQAMKGGDFQRADAHATQPVFREHALELERHGSSGRTDGREEADVLGADPTGRQREGRRRGTVQPLQVIHRHEQDPNSESLRSTPAMPSIARASGPEPSGSARSSATSRARRRTGSSESDTSGITLDKRSERPRTTAPPRPRPPGNSTPGHKPHRPSPAPPPTGPPYRSPPPRTHQRRGPTLHSLQERPDRAKRVIRPIRLVTVMNSGCFLPTRRPNTSPAKPEPPENRPTASRQPSARSNH